MIRDPMRFGFYSKPNQLLTWMVMADREALLDRWSDEAAQAAIDGNPARAGYVDHMAGRLSRP